jgi:hypothetical protein
MSVAGVRIEVRCRCVRFACVTHVFVISSVDSELVRRSFVVHTNDDSSHRHFFIQTRYRNELDRANATLVSPICFDPLCAGFFKRSSLRTRILPFPLSLLFRPPIHHITQAAARTVARQETARQQQQVIIDPFVRSFVFCGAAIVLKRAMLSCCRRLLPSRRHRHRRRR